MKKVFYVLLSIVLVIGIIITSKLFIYMHGIYSEGVDINCLDDCPHFYDGKGEEVSILYNSQFLDYCSIDDLKDYTYNSFVAIEDKRFFSHHGFDIKRLVSAIIHYVTGTDSFGASTITQQLVKNITEDNDIEIERKIREIARAVYVEDNLSKKEILEKYLNCIYFGEGAYGINSASNVFFSKKSSELSIAESATLAAMPYAPEGNNPYTSKEGKERLLKRQKIVLKLMLEQDMISHEQYEYAINEEIVFSYNSNIALKQYLRLVMKEVMQKLSSSMNMSRKELEKYVFNSNIKIYTNLDLNFQEYLYEASKRFFGNDDIETSIVVSNKSGEVIAALSSRTNSEYNRATDMLRQPGSIFKPLAVYAPAFDMDILLPDSIVIDEPIYVDLGNGKRWEPENWYHYFEGECTVSYALAKSINTVAVKELANVGIENSVRYLEKFGVTSLESTDHVYPLALGGITKGVSPFEMTRAYNVFTNDGIYTDISFVKKLCIGSHESVAFTKESYRLLDEDSNLMMDECMRYNVTSGALEKAELNGVNVRAKTGTTENLNDYWVAGYTDELTAVLWVGYDMPKSIESYSSLDICDLWRILMRGYYG